MPVTAVPHRLRRLLAYVEALLDVEDFDGVEQVLLPGLAELTGSEFSVYHHVDLGTELGEINFFWPRATFRPEILQAYSTYMGEHPFVERFRGGRYPREPIRISDVMSGREWRSSRFYCESHRLLGAGEQMSLILASRDAHARAVSVGRVRRTYTDAERELMTLAGPHLLRALRRAYAGRSTVMALKVVPTVAWVRIAPPDAVLSPVSAAATAAGLTPRELEVLHLRGAGLTNAAIARRLGSSEGTVRKHLEHAYAKLGVSNRVSALRRLTGT